MRHGQRTGWGCCLGAPGLTGFLCTLPQAGEATKQELRLPRGSCAFPSSLSLPPGGSGGHLRAPCPAPFVVTRGHPDLHRAARAAWVVRGCLVSLPGVGEPGWGERNDRAMEYPASEGTHMVHRVQLRTLHRTPQQIPPLGAQDQPPKQPQSMSRGRRGEAAVPRHKVVPSPWDSEEGLGRRGPELEEPGRTWESMSRQDNYFFNQVFSKHLILLLYSSISIAERLRWNLKGILHNNNNVSYRKRQSLLCPANSQH